MIGGRILVVTVAALMATVVFALAAGSAFATTCALDCNPIKDPVRSR
jgi:hypothetical protein